MEELQTVHSCLRFKFKNGNSDERLTKKKKLVTVRKI